MSGLREEILQERKSKRFNKLTTEDKTNKYEECYTEFNIDLNKLTTTKTLHIDRIKDLEDVKRVLKFLNITVEADGVVEPHGYNEVRDLFEY